MTAKQLSALFEKRNLTRIITLNRPPVNAINTEMLDLIEPNVIKYEKEEQIIILRGSERAFCAGGDVKEMASYTKTNIKKALEFFKREYTFVNFLSSCKVPVVSIMDGICMGGGVGLAGHVPFRVATERLQYAMPENQIGLFPDVAGSFLLSRLGSLGLYYGLTGASINGQDAVTLGLCSHFISSDKIPFVIDRISEINTCEPEAVNLALEEYAEPVLQPLELQPFRQTIKDCFQGSLMEIEQKLKKSNCNFSKETLKKLSICSPLSLQVTLDQFEFAKTKSVSECLQNDWKLCNTMLTKHFATGVKAKLVDKTTPIWPPATFDLLDCKPLKLRQNNRLDLPFGLPSEEYIKSIIKGTHIKVGDYAFKSFQDVLNWIPLRKVGLREHVLRILEQNCTVGEYGVKWKN